MENAVSLHSMKKDTWRKQYKWLEKKEGVSVLTHPLALFNYPLLGLLSNTY